MYQFKITEKTDADAIQKAHMQEGVHMGVFIPMDKQMRKFRKSADDRTAEKSEDDSDLKKGKGVMDEAKWEKAKKVVAKQKKAPKDKHAMISHIYQQMGGKYSSESKKSEFDSDDLMKAAGAHQYVRREPDGKGGWTYYYRDPKTGKVVSGKKLSAKKRFTAHKEQHEKHRKEFYAAKTQDVRSEARRKGERHLEAASTAKKESEKKKTKKSEFSSNDLMKAATG